MTSAKQKLAWKCPDCQTACKMDTLVSHLATLQAVNGHASRDRSHVNVLAVEGCDHVDHYVNEVLAGAGLPPNAVTLPSAASSETEAE